MRRWTSNTAAESSRMRITCAPANTLDARAFELAVKVGVRSLGAHAFQLGQPETIRSSAMALCSARTSVRLRKFRHDGESIQRVFCLRTLSTERESKQQQNETQATVVDKPQFLLYGQAGTDPTTTKSKNQQNQPITQSSLLIGCRAGDSLSRALNRFCFVTELASPCRKIVIHVGVTI